MKTHEMIDVLCFDDDGEDTTSPYPLEAIYTLEGLRSKELRALLATFRRDEELPAWETLGGDQRREMAKALGATEGGDDAKLARAAAEGLDAVAKAASRVGVSLQFGRRSRAELVQLAGHLYARVPRPDGVTGAQAAVTAAKDLLAEIDVAMGARSVAESVFDSVLASAVEVAEDDPPPFEIEDDRPHAARFEEGEAEASRLAFQRAEDAKPTVEILPSIKDGSTDADWA